MNTAEALQLWQLIIDADPIMDSDVFNAWPLVLIIEDCYVPEHAVVTLKFIGELDESTISLVLGFAADQAREEMNVN